MSITWEDPPPPLRGSRASGIYTKTAERLDALSANPGKWLVWNESPSTKSAQVLACALRKKYSELEVTYRGTKVYARRRAT